ncbi:hypothetical protein, partial [Blastococcus sp. KM273128]|uniref:hypothetical protein n=1 Tax=Blastococcus sp. KM273128 TaxID=2570314 RepID=UPI001F1FF73C
IGPSTRPILAGQEHFSVDQHPVTPLSRESPGLAPALGGSELTESSLIQQVAFVDPSQLLYDQLCGG